MICHFHSTKVGVSITMIKVFLLAQLLMVKETVGNSMDSITPELDKHFINIIKAGWLDLEIRLLFLVEKQKVRPLW